VLKRELDTKYWTSLTILHFAASFLDPSLKHFRFVTDIDDRDGFFRQVREAILSLAREPDVSNEPQPSANSIRDNSATTDADMPPKKKVKVNPFDWFQHAPDGTTIQTASTTTASTEPLNDRVLKEMREYETEPLPCHTAIDVSDQLYWWRQHERSYPILFDCARRLLVIPASSAECERHFSAFNARHTSLPRSETCSFPKLSIVLKGYKNKLLQ